MSEEVGWVMVCNEKSLKNGDMLDFDQGIMNEEENTVTCPLHLSAFKLDTGMPQNLPAEEPIKTYKVKIQDNAIYIKLD